MNLSKRIFSIFILIFIVKIGRNSGTFFRIPSRSFEHQNNDVYHTNEEDDISSHNIIDVPLLIESYGYPAERHSVITEDGYILEIHRIPHGKNRFSSAQNFASDFSTQSSIKLQEHSSESSRESSIELQEQSSESSREKTKKRIKKVLKETIKKFVFPDASKESSREFVKKSSREFLNKSSRELSKQSSTEFSDETLREISRDFSRELSKESSREFSRESSKEFSMKSSRQFLNDSSSRGSRPVVFLVHCALCSSSIWVMQGPQNGLGFMLADEGYDVWMLNVRGTSYSSKHLKYSVEMKKFWDFSWHEGGIYDVTASIDYILRLRNRTSVTYIGYSMGTSIFFSMASSRPEYNRKIDKMIAMAPAAYLKDGKGFFPELSNHMDLLVNYYDAVKTYHVPSGSINYGKFMQLICDSSDNVLKMNMCAAVLDFVGKINFKNFDWKHLKYYFKFFPDTMSLNSILHFLQIIITDRFELFDYGPVKNARIYGSLQPPLYNLSKITTPVHLLYSLYDSITPPSGVARLYSNLPNAYLYEIDIPYFSHAHFCWSVNAREVVYDNVVDLLKNGKVT